MDADAASIELERRAFARSSVWHHTRTGPLNRNYASTRPWLDWLFGTLHLPRTSWPEAYGIKAAMPDSFPGQLVYPLLSDPPRASASAPAISRDPLPNSPQ